MSRSYDRNIERLKANQRQISAQEQSITTEEARLSGESGIRAAQALDKLTPFSNALKEWKLKDIEKKKAQGVAAARKAKLEQSKLLTEQAKKIQAIEEAKRVGDLAAEFKDAEAMDVEYQRLKKQMLQTVGTSAYPDADRLAQLSPWQQVGYAQEKLRVFNDSFEDKLAHAMQNSEEMIELGGLKFTPKEIADKNLAFPMKQAAIEVLAEKIRKSHNVDNFSPEMLKLSKTESVIQKAKEAQLSKYRERYNIESSMITRQKAGLEWQRSEKTAYNLEKLLLMNSATVDLDGDLLGNTGAWKNVEAILVADGVAQHNPEYAHKILDQPMTDNMCRELGVKKGTTFSQQWPKRTAEIKAKIKEGYVKEVNDEEKFLNAAGTEKTNEFKAEAREKVLTTAEVNEYKAEFQKLGLPIPSDITKYETATMRSEREDKQKLEALMDSQQGKITREQAEQFHPGAVQELGLWDKIEKWEAADVKAFDSEKKIKSVLDKAFTNMGIKANEKSPAYVEAMSNAKADYAIKYNRYVAMGYPPEDASYLALHANEVKDKETGEVLPDSMGVIAEIKQNAEGSKYVVTGQSVEKSIKEGDIRVARIASGKRELLENPTIISKGVIGGDYGKKQIDTIHENITKYGLWRGINNSKNAVKYYEGLARNRNYRETGGHLGIIDKQLKAAGYDGLWPDGVPPDQSLMTGKNQDGERIPDPDGLRSQSAHAFRALQFAGSTDCYLYAEHMLRDTDDRWATGSVWDESDALQPWLTGGY